MLRIEDYILEYKLGSGSFSEVYYTTKKKSNQVFATKRVDKSKALSENMKNYFLNEIDILKNTNNSNVIKLYEVKNSENNFYLVMEYCNGGTLEEFFEKYYDKFLKPFPEAFVHHILKQISNGIYYLHKSNIIHRDLKLENILLHFESLEDKNKMNLLKANIKIIDFGFAKYTDDTTPTTSICGSPISMDPIILKALVQKQIGKEFKYTEKSDMWSLGIMVFTMLIGKPPFIASEYNYLYQLISEGNYQIPKRLNLSKQAIDLINSLLQFETKDRLSIDELIVHKFLTLEEKDFEYCNLNLLDKGKLEINLNIKKELNQLWDKYELENKKENGSLSNRGDFRANSMYDFEQNNKDYSSYDTNRNFNAFYIDENNNIIFTEEDKIKKKNSFCNFNNIEQNNSISYNSNFPNSLNLTNNFNSNNKTANIEASKFNSSFNSKDINNINYSAFYNNAINKDYVKSAYISENQINNPNNDLNSIHTFSANNGLKERNTRMFFDEEGISEKIKIYENKGKELKRVSQILDKELGSFANSIKHNQNSFDMNNKNEITYSSNSPYKKIKPAEKSITSIAPLILCSNNNSRNINFLSNYEEKLNHDQTIFQINNYNSSSTKTIYRPQSLMSFTSPDILTSNILNNKISTEHLNSNSHRDSVFLKENNIHQNYTTDSKEFAFKIDYNQNVNTQSENVNYNKDLSKELNLSSFGNSSTTSYSKTQKDYIGDINFKSLNSTQNNENISNVLYSSAHEVNSSIKNFITQNSHFNNNLINGIYGSKNRNSNSNKNVSFANTDILNNSKFNYENIMTSNTKNGSILDITDNNNIKNNNNYFSNFKFHNNLNNSNPLVNRSNSISNNRYDEINNNYPDCHLLKRKNSNGFNYSQYVNVNKEDKRILNQNSNKILNDLKNSIDNSIDEFTKINDIFLRLNDNNNIETKIFNALKIVKNEMDGAINLIKNDQ